MGKGKGPIKYWFSRTLAGKTIFQTSLIDEKRARLGLRLVQKIFPMPTKIYHNDKFLSARSFTFIG
jgi:ribosomal protein L16/L10AE